MDVTCERCGTEYDFDDALVSERGTTVKCTNCGAQFRVFRPVPAAGPERWVVRTVDGRELVFSALRELQAAISTGVVGREDVLSRGGGRPRRLGSIAELEPFFKQAVVVAATSTAPGLGLPTARAFGRQDGSVAFAMGGAGHHDRSASSALKHDDSLPKRSGTLPPPPPILNLPGAGDRSEVRATSGHRAEESSSKVSPINTSVTGSMQPTSVAVGQAARLQNLVAADLAEPITMPRSDQRPNGASVEVRGVREQALAVPIGPAKPTAPPVIASPGNRSLVSDATIQDNGAGFADTVAVLNETRTQVEGPLARDREADVARKPGDDAAIAPARKPEESGVVEKRGGVRMDDEPPPAIGQRARREVSDRSQTPLLDAAAARLRSAEERPRPKGAAMITPTPGEVRVSYLPEPEPSVSPRFSMAAASRRSSSVRWIVGVVLIGATALLGATVGRQYFTAQAPAPTVAAPAADDRVTKLLAEGEKLLGDGDLEGAKERFDKASVLAETDPQVAIHLAYLSVVRADLRWLKVRALPISGSDVTLAKSELDDSIVKMKKAVEAAKTLAPNDSSVKRYRLDALRIAGDRAGARALAGEISSSGNSPEVGLSLAALDLSEEKPSWPSVIERLRAATVADGNLGRARAMLVFALASSGDVASAKAEHDRLMALPKTHPLAGPLLAFMARIETDRPEASGGSATGGGNTKTATSATPTGASTGGNAPSTGGNTPPVASAGSQTASGAGATLPGGRVADDYVAPNAGTVDISDMHGHPPPPTPQPSQAPTPQPSPSPAPTAAPPAGVDTSDLPGFGKP